MLYHFHVNLFGNPFICTWEEAAARLESLSRMAFEPDGSWIWSGSADGRRWQVDGHLFDFEGKLHRVELHGTCPRELFDRMLGCFDWPEVELSFEMVQEGSRLGESEFRRAMETLTAN